QDRRIDVDDDLIPLARCLPDRSRGAGRSRRARPARRPAAGRTRVAPRPGPGTFPRERFCLSGRCPGVRPAYAVFVLIHMARAAPVALRALLRFGDAIHPSPAPDDALDMLRSAGVIK